MDTPLTDTEERLDAAEAEVARLKDQLREVTCRLDDARLAEIEDEEHADFCSCTFATAGWREAHDRLAHFEERGTAGFVDLLNAMVLDGFTELVDPDDFQRFVAEHNWADPAAVSQLAEALALWHSERADLEVARSLVTMVGAAYKVASEGRLRRYVVLRDA